MDSRLSPEQGEQFKRDGFLIFDQWHDLNVRDALDRLDSELQRHPPWQVVPLGGQDANVSRSHGRSLIGSR